MSSTRPTLRSDSHTFFFPPPFPVLYARSTQNLLLVCDTLLYSRAMDALCILETLFPELARLPTTKRRLGLEDLTERLNSLVLVLTATLLA